MANKKQVDEQFKLAFNTYFDNISRFCNVKLKNRNEAQDCAQECFTIFYKKLLQGVDVENTGAYLYKIADNLVNAQFRKYKKMLNMVPLDELNEEPCIDAFSDYSDLDYDVLTEKIIDRLNDKEKQLYQLRYIENKSLAELSEILEISFTAVAQRLFRLREKVREFVEQEMKGEILF